MIEHYTMILNISNESKPLFLTDYGSFAFRYTYENKYLQLLSKNISLSLKGMSY